VPPISEPPSITPARCHDEAALPVSEDVSTRIMALPIHPDLTDEQAQRVAQAVRSTLKA
jgi:dTDP-4-amino-4,6-dideoxygalactose transaminase